MVHAWRVMCCVLKKYVVRSWQVYAEHLVHATKKYVPCVRPCWFSAVWGMLHLFTGVLSRNIQVGKMTAVKFIIPDSYFQNEAQILPFFANRIVYNFIILSILIILNILSILSMVVLFVWTLLAWQRAGTRLGMAFLCKHTRKTETREHKYRYAKVRVVLRWDIYVKTSLVKLAYLDDFKTGKFINSGW